ncbi:YidC/Oxa1 family membrane protein insertase [Solicola gregarius]|uniref:Membrane protein insertase YidC n=1 Tax=Solicola gregarius TaxID=2908642 RepID=A0AA46TFX9_9ACTN|nr:YidC/Oxa1 family membrane protein insertase [Solicola gregarius]UYM03848.1 YidC/Oxa1 family membrane protein insertase [Solicola gregarius]
MNIYDFPPIEALITAAYWLVTNLSDLLQPLVGAPSAAVAIVLMTVAVRTLLIPVGRSQVKAGITRRRLAPKIAELRRRHAKKPERLQREITELYAKEKASPLAGCLPVLAQMPILMAVYGLFVHQTINDHPNELLGHTLLGVPLDVGLVGQLNAGAVTWVSGGVFIAIVVVVAVVAQASRRMLMPPQTPEETDPQPGVPDLSGLTRALSFMPFMTAVIAAFVPLAAGLYLMTTTAWTLAERVVLNRLLGVARLDAT